MTQDFSSKVVGKKQMGLRGFRVCLDTTYYWKLKIKNWKYCKKIIFKCVNSIMRLIFNENFAKKEVCGSCEQYTGPTNKHILMKILMVKEVCRSCE